MLIFFFFNDTATTEIYTLSLHDALPIFFRHPDCWMVRWSTVHHQRRDRKSTRLNSSHSQISYAVFCLKKKKQMRVIGPTRMPGTRTRRCEHLLRIWQGLIEQCHMPQVAC